MVSPATIFIGASFISSETSPSLSYTGTKESNLYSPTLDLTAFYHEFGHVLGSIFQRNPKANLFQVPMSFNEIPSLFMENFVQDYRVVSSFAINKKTSQAIPRVLPFCVFM